MKTQAEPNRRFSVTIMPLRHRIYPLGATIRFNRAGREAIESIRQRLAARSKVTLAEWGPLSPWLEADRWGFKIHTKRHARSIQSRQGAIDSGVLSAVECELLRLVAYQIPE
jgi:hypothetical protein